MKLGKPPRDSDAGEQRITLRLSSLAFGGDAVGRDDEGRVTFVAGGAPGDLVRVRLTERKKAYARGDLEQVIEPGARVAAPCPLVDRGADSCGGCPWQHVELAAQLAAKEEIVRHALEKSGALVEPILPAPAWLGYRTRAKMTGRGRAIGFHAHRSHRVVDVDHCLALDPRLDAAMQAARQALGSALGEEGTLSGLLAPDGEVQLAIEPGWNAAPETLADLAGALLHAHGIAGVTVRAQGTTRVYGAPLLDIGSGHLASAAGFAQANFAQNEVLRRLVRSLALPAGEPGERRLLELYAGDGNFTRDLVARAQVVAVESDRDAAARLIENLRLASPRTPTSQRWSVRAESAATATRKLAEAGERFDVVVLDPPRSGALDALSDLVALFPERIVYISCDPMTLARDLGRLTDSGYRATRAQPIDMMPHAAHVEVVALVERIS